ncbi:MAG TPA: hypothetical protein VF950_22880 [Planctomycetota bacterium]
MTDFSSLGHSDANPFLATLDYAAASVFFLIGPMMLVGWRRWTFTRPEGVPELIVLAVGSLMAGGFFLLLTVGAARGLLRALP